MSNASSHDRVRPEHGSRTEVVTTAVKAAAGSAGGFGGILAAASIGAIPVPLAGLGVVVFGVVMVGALALAGAYTISR